MKNEWKDNLSPEQRAILHDKGTEAPFSGSLLKNESEGTYLCAACSQELFSSSNKYDSGSGWPSFDDVIDQGKVHLESDTTMGMERTEVVCNNCGGHLGHVFSDGPETTGQRYCINSVSLNFKPSDKSKPIKRGDE